MNDNKLYSSYKKVEGNSKINQNYDYCTVKCKVLVDKA